MDWAQMVRGATGLVYDNCSQSESELPDCPERLQLISRCQNIGSTIELVNNILEGGCGNGMAVIRTKDNVGSFQNVMEAVQRALKIRQAERIMIVDWTDDHRGQSVQRVSNDEDRVLYFSVRRRKSDSDSIGEGKGKGYRFNIPLNAEKMLDAELLALWQQLLMPVAIEFQPDLVIVTAGALGITPACYAHLISPLLTLARGRLAVILEESDNCHTAATTESIHCMLRTLLGDPCPPLGEAPSSVSAAMRTEILNCTRSHRPFWRSLQVHSAYEPDREYDRPEVVHMRERIPNGNGYEQNGEMKKEQAQQHTALEDLMDSEATGAGVGFVFDEVMLEHRDLFDDHPECPDRLIAIRQRLLDCGLLPSRLQPIVSRCATTAELCTVHSGSYVQRIRGSTDEGTPIKASSSGIFPTVYRHPGHFTSASLATGSVLAATEAVLRGQLRSAICAIRPPGHHAEHADSDGFSIFNHVAVAAKVALRDLPSVEKVLIVDWDIHHGHGTQRLFESNPNVLYISVHRCDEAAFVPRRRDAAADQVGRGVGSGFNVNIPWSRAGMGDAEYAAIFQRLILPIAYEFGPDLVLVSAGFDAAVGDALGGCRVSAQAFGHFTAWLLALAGGRMVLALEGGYNRQSTAWAMTMCAKAMLGDPLPPLQVAGVRLAMNWGAAASAARTLQRVWSVQAEWWRSVRGWNVRMPADETALMHRKWFCLDCHRNECNCYLKAQQFDHNSIHPDVSLMLSIDDSSCWCYVCQAYIDTPQFCHYRNGR